MSIFRQEICYKQQKQEWQQLDEQLAESNQAGNLKITGFFSKPCSRWEGTRRGLRAPSSPLDAGVGCLNLGASKAKQQRGLFLTSRKEPAEDVVVEDHFIEGSGIHNPSKRMEEEPQNTSSGFRKSWQWLYEKQYWWHQRKLVCWGKKGGWCQKRPTWLNYEIFIVLKQSKQTVRAMRSLPALTVPAQPPAAPLPDPAHGPGSPAVGTVSSSPQPCPVPGQWFTEKHIRTNTCEPLYESNKMSYKQCRFVRKKLCQFVKLLQQDDKSPGQMRSGQWRSSLPHVIHCQLRQRSTLWTNCNKMVEIVWKIMLKDCLRLISLSRWTGSTLSPQLLSIFVDDLEDGMKMSVKVTESMKRKGLWRKVQFEIIRVLTDWRKKLEIIRGPENIPCEGNLNKQG